MKVLLTRVYLKKERMYTYLFGRYTKKETAAKLNLDYKNIDTACLSCELVPCLLVLTTVLRIYKITVLSVAGKKNQELLEAEQACLDTYMLKREEKKA